MTNTQTPAPAATVPCRCTGRLSETCAYHRWLAQPATYSLYLQRVERHPWSEDEGWIAELLATTPTAR